MQWNNNGSKGDHKNKPVVWSNVTEDLRKTQSHSVLPAEESKIQWKLVKVMYLYCVRSLSSWNVTPLWSQSLKCKQREEFQKHSFVALMLWCSAIRETVVLYKLPWGWTWIFLLSHTWWKQKWNECEIRVHTQSKIIS